jgi:PrcB C-terminal
VPTRAFSLAILAVLAACGGSTVRPADDPDAIAPAPSPAPSPPVVDPAPAPTPGPPAPPPATPPSARGTAPEKAATDLEIRRIGRWISSGIKGARQLVIRDPATWSQFWSELGAGVRPQVDFGRDLVIAVASGERSSGGHDIEVQRVTRAGGDLRIEVLRTSPGANCMATAALTQPVDVVLVPAAGVTGWSFIDRTATTDC